MSDQIERLIEAVKEVSKHIQRLTIYFYPINLGRAGTAVTSGISALLGILGFCPKLVGTIASTTSLIGLFRRWYFDGLVAAISTCAANFDLNPKCIGNITGISDENGVLKVSTQLIGNAASGTVVFGSLA